MPAGVVVAVVSVAFLGRGAGQWGGVSGFRLDARAGRRVSVEVGGSVYLVDAADDSVPLHDIDGMRILFADGRGWAVDEPRAGHGGVAGGVADGALDRKSTRLNSSH